MPENICLGKLVEFSGCKVYPVTERYVKPAVVVTNSVLSENSKSGITQDFPHCYKYVKRSKCMTVVNMMIVTSYTPKGK